MYNSILIACESSKALASLRLAIFAFSIILVQGHAQALSPQPLLAPGHGVNWWFTFKFNAAKFPGCTGTTQRACPFGGSPQAYKNFSQQYVFSSNENPALQEGKTCVGDDTLQDPLATTFEQVYRGKNYFVVWNDQFYSDPQIKGCTTSCSAPWGHSKGMLTWNEAGEGFVLQVSTPSWPGAGSIMHPRQEDGNSLGCVKDNNVQVSQHFFALKLSKSDLVQVLMALQNASVVTNPSDSQIVHNGGPLDVQSLVNNLGKKSQSTAVQRSQLSTGIILISKPSKLHVAPWQLVSSVLGGVDLRTATWWANPKIPSTTASTEMTCWDSSLDKPGAVQVATSGHWADKEFGLQGGPGTNFNHAKIGVSTNGTHKYSIFGDLNQQGTITGPKCESSQNGRGGLFYVIDNPQLHQSITGLIAGDTADSAP